MRCEPPTKRSCCAPPSVSKSISRPPAGVDVEQDVQQRHVLRLGGPDGLDAELEQHATGSGGEVAAHPGRGRLAVEGGRVGRLPGGVERHLAGHAVEPPLGALHVEQHDRVDARDRPAVAAQPPAVLDHVLALPVGGEGLDAELGGQRGQAVLRRADPLGAHLDDVPAADVLVQDPPADAVAGLHDDHGGAGRGRRARRGQPGQAGSDHDEVGVTGLRLRHRGRNPIPAAPSLWSLAMGSPPRTSREEEQRLNMRTLVIASAASATAALVTSRLWIAGTWIAAALTPVLVTLVSEMLRRPTERIARGITVDRPALPDPDAPAPRAEAAAAERVAERLRDVDELLPDPEARPRAPARRPPPRTSTAASPFAARRGGARSPTAWCSPPRGSPS